MEITPEIRQAIERYLTSVGDHAAAMDDQDRRELLDQLEAHIHHALEERSGGMIPSVDDVLAILAEMDPPNSYGQPASSVAPAKKPTALGKIGLCISLGSLIAARLTGSIPQLGAVTAILLLGGQVAAVVLGIIDWKSPFGKAAVLTTAMLIVVPTVVVFWRYASSSGPDSYMPANTVNGMTPATSQPGKPDIRHIESPIEAVGQPDKSE